MPNTNFVAKSYINAIKNPAKKTYANTYYEWILKGRQGDAPSAWDLTYMGAQAVRLNLDEITKQNDR